MAIHRKVRECGLQGIKAQGAEAQLVSMIACHTFASDFAGCSKSGAEHYRHCACSAAVLLRTSEQKRPQGGRAVARDIQGTDSLRAIDLVPGEAQQIDAEARD